MGTLTIDVIQPEDGSNILTGLIILLQDTVDSGASVGFLPPLAQEEASSTGVRCYRMWLRARRYYWWRAMMSR
ncbi:hypothetical protein KDK_53020 [Dictyobacter kobayashii]|uniref:Uncharacterized protein n=1 Tax=Dictyobacter kobayashii TaxID=2014872 RepID=A0A402AQY7_9CHLR|nr:hypothetical protein [Dictyobacter kobayashii]GCE21502.1 hypothetical protein KDK_53020 [Dictyobacter kobayashii]